jgi:hypothetical protein
MPLLHVHPAAAPRRRVWMAAGVMSLTGLLGGCATLGGPIPSSGDPSVAVADAQRAIETARQAGADSLAAGELASARQYRAAAQEDLRKRDAGRSALNARQARADADYARALARRVAAERARSDAQAALGRLP